MEERTYNSFLADIIAVLTHNPTYDLATAASVLQQDGLAQIVTYIYPHSHIRALDAASPRTRLRRDVIASPQRQLYRHFAFGMVDRRRYALFYRQDDSGSAVDIAAFQSQLWWVWRCAVPLVALEWVNDDGQLLRSLPPAMLPRVLSLSICVMGDRVCNGPSALNCDGHCGSLLCRLADFVHLTALHLRRDTQHTYPLEQQLPAHRRLDAEIRHVLQSLRTLRLSEINLRSLFPTGGEFSVLAQTTELECFRAQTCGVHSLAGLRTCFMLREIYLSYCSSLTEVSALAGSATLETFHACGCNLRSLDGLGSCPRLQEVDVSSNRSLGSVAGLAGAPRLRSLKAVHCGLRSVDGLWACPALLDVDLSWNALTDGVDAIARMAGLHTLKLEWCDLQSVRALSDLRGLTRLIVSCNHELTTLDFDAGCGIARSLVFLNAVRCGLRDCGVLNTFKKLRDVNISRNPHLHSLITLRGAPELEVLKVYGGALTTLEGLSECPRLAGLDLTRNAGLTSLSALADAPAIAKVWAGNCNVTQLDGLAQCAHLFDLNLSGNRNLRSVAALSGAPALEVLTASNCDLQEVDGLSSCPRLMEVDVSRNARLTSLAGLEGAPRLTRLVAEYCALTDVSCLRQCPSLQSVSFIENAVPVGELVWR